jgi:dihydroorotase/N-acyl-D-amino-acid deacylase
MALKHWQVATSWLLFLIAAAITCHAQTAGVDLLIKNARIVDGTGSPWYRGDVAIRGDTIVQIAARIDQPAAHVIDARGDVVAPGFIDIHTHAREGIFNVPTAENYVRQGVTTLIEGPDGNSPVPLRPFLERVESLRITPNFGAFIGHGSIRENVLGAAKRTATPAELERMRALVRQGMEDGAFGLSSGLFYVPGTFAPTDEVVDLARVAGQMGGIHVSHMRNEAAGILDSVRETIEIGERGGLATQVTHHKVIGKPHWGKTVQTLQLIDAARARGIDATIDQYPYTASSTRVQAALMPAWALEGGRDRIVERLRTASTREQIKKETIRLIKEERGGGDPQNVQLARCTWDESLAGKRLGDVTKQRGLQPTPENAAETALWIVEQGDCIAVFHAIDETDLQRVLRHPATMVASDGEVPVFGQASPHPRSYGTFARVLGRYVRELRVITLEDAVRKMSAYPAQRLGLMDRGVLRAGLKADLVVFDPAEIQDLATFEQPHQYARGVSLVVVNGDIAFQDGKMTEARPGRVLHGPAYK